MKTFIAELMPAYPIYISLLPEAARGVIGQCIPIPPRRGAILEKEGFSWRGSVDIFDAGPVLEADTDQIRAVRDSQRLPVRQLMATLPAPTSSPTVNSTTFGRCWWPTKSRSRLTAPRWTRCRS